MKKNSPARLPVSHAAGAKRSASAPKNSSEAMTKITGSGSQGRRRRNSRIPTSAAMPSSATPARATSLAPQGVPDTSTPVEELWNSERGADSPEAVLIVWLKASSSTGNR